MVGVIEISGAIGGLKSALDILKGLKSTADAVAINDAKIGLQTAIIDAQQGLMAAQEAQTSNLNRIRDLEQQIAQIDDWNREREGYNLIEIYDGAYAFNRKPTIEDGEPQVWLCANCFEQRKKSILQRQGSTFQVGGGKGFQIHWSCPSCLTSIDVPMNLNPISFAQRRAAGS